MALVDCVYTSAAVNASPQCLDWSPTSGFVAYGASNAVLLAPPELNTISDTLVGHEQRVNCVKWVRDGNFKATDSFDESSIPNKTEEIVSGSRDGTIRIWKQAASSSSSPSSSSPSSSSPSFTCTQILRGHDSSVNVVDAFRFDGVEENGGKTVTTLIASAASDASIRIWRRVEGGGGGGEVGSGEGEGKVGSGDDGSLPPFECIVESLPKSFSFSFALRWTLIPEDSSSEESHINGDLQQQQSRNPVAILLVSGDDSNIHVYSQSSSSSSSTSSSTSSSSTCSLSLVSTLRGHEDWVRSLDVAVVSSEDAKESQSSSSLKKDLLIASGSQDAVVRLWRFKSSNLKVSTKSSSIVGLKDEKVAEVKLKSRRFLIEDGREVGVTLESVLLGHEGSVYSVCWHADGGSLLSSSMDKTLIIWKLDPDSGVWLDETRVGEVGGNTLGFYGALFGYESGRISILGHDFQGALHLWRKSSSDSSSQWRPRHAIGGHFRSVEDVSWDSFDGGYGLLSVGDDQTTRMHAPWKKGDSSSIEGSRRDVWVQMGRPQIHGHDMTCVAAVAPGFRFISGADEKVLRVFEAPNNFFDVVGKLSGVRVEKSLKVGVTGGEEVGAVIGAAVPALGLSNKAIREGAAPGDINADEFLNAGLRIHGPPKEISFNNKGLVVHPKPATATSSDEPPLETDLLQNTLWPEAQKLYGHGNPLFCLASSVDGAIQASACKAAKAEEAAILLWGGAERQWRHLGEAVGGHSLTVTQMAFGKTRLNSPSPTHLLYRLLSVSRDRTIVVTEIRVPVNVDDDDITTQIIFRTNKSDSVHSRIIWSCDWAHDDAFFVTASRDKKVVAWRKNDEANCFLASTPALLTDSCSAVSCASRCFGLNAGDKSSDYLVAVGLDNGQIHLLLFDFAENVFRELFRFAKNICHHLTVKRLAFRPAMGRACGGDEAESGSALQLASCGADGFVRVYDVSER